MSDSTQHPQEPGANPGPEGTGPARAGALTPQQRLAGMDKRDLGILGAGVLALLASFLPYYTMSFDGFQGIGGVSESASAWHGFLGWFGVLCALAAAGVLGAHLFGVALPFPVRLVVLALFAVALLCTLLALFVYPGESCEDAVGAFMTDEICDSFDEGRGAGYWLALLSTAAGTALAAMRRTAG